MLAQQIERAVTSASLPWLGAVPAPHRLLRACSSPAVLVELGQDQLQGLYIPCGVAHGFAALSDVVLVYVVDNYYDGADELGVAWNDPALQ
ncbi:MAG: dTDP-4-dehydrorhamnose 3,5-epimerase family protein, partial [Candidatus Sumerlaeia bacterium]|nr:dTDP-4-dehydrorhamnose 3,5-epimerase family protein [Candidatus Sumerlaeia bacterium]